MAGSVFDWQRCKRVLDRIFLGANVSGGHESNGTLNPNLSGTCTVTSDFTSRAISYRDGCSREPSAGSPVRPSFLHCVIHVLISGPRLGAGR